MDKAPLVLLGTTLLLSGCVSQQDALQVQAKVDFQTAKEQCSSHNYTTHLDQAKCLDDALRRTVYIYANNKDLWDELMAQRELLSSKIDSHELSQEEANLQFMQFKSTSVEQESLRKEQQQAYAIAAFSLMQQMNPPPQPQPIYQTPTYQAPVAHSSPIVNCNSTPIGSTIYTNCY